eukprot:TRINITY_DN24991_c0_g2_i2.p1 TRINITY_DN24991_c0_g2~~TRINITY_DN24991_c0_g2_i2.p1  ORF type:complete len:338 (+),score=77.83 TRINITY_DN24991_c0_g2_i2:101-1114(+)
MNSLKGIGHKTYNHMLPSAKKQVVWPHHDLLRGSKTGDHASFVRAVERFRRVAKQKDMRRLFVLTHIVRTQEALETIRYRQAESITVPPFKRRLETPDCGCPELVSVDEMVRLFQDLKHYVSGDFHLDVVYLVVPGASEARERPSTRAVLSEGNAGGGRGPSLTVRELHCTDGNTGLFFKAAKDLAAFKRLVLEPRRFELVEIDSSRAQGYSDTLSPRIKRAAAMRTARPLRRRPAGSGKAALGKTQRPFVAKRKKAKRAGSTEKSWLQLAARAGGADRRLRVLVENPKRSGSEAHLRFEKYKKAKTIGEFFKLGGVPGDLKHDCKNGFVKILGRGS